MGTRFPQFPEYSIEFEKLRSQRISRPTELLAEADPESSPLSREQCELKRLMGCYKTHHH